MNPEAPNTWNPDELDKLREEQDPQPGPEVRIEVPNKGHEIGFDVPDPSPAEKSEERAVWEVNLLKGHEDSKDD